MILDGRIPAAPGLACGTIQKSVVCKLSEWPEMYPPNYVKPDHNSRPVAVAAKREAITVRKTRRIAQRSGFGTHAALQRTVGWAESSRPTESVNE